MPRVGTATVRSPAVPDPPSRDSWHAPSARNGLTVFFVSGMLMSFLGAVLPVWGYHIRGNLVEAGRYFLAMAIGLAVSYPSARLLLARRGVRWSVTAGCGLAAVAFLWLGAAAPPAAWGWRAGGVVLLGLSAGWLNAAAFQSISRIYEHDPASTVNMAGTLFGLGCLVTVAGLRLGYYVYDATSLMILLAVPCAFAAGLYWRSGFLTPAAHERKPVQRVFEEVRSPGAVLFSLILFFQLGNEWSIAGWLPVFLVQRVGLSPERAILLLAAYWLALTLGRVLAQGLLAQVGHGKLLISSVAASLTGCLILLSTNNYFGCWVGTLLCGAGYSAVYPLVIEKIGSRFPDYHPGFYNGLLSLGTAGGLVVPWLLGYAATWAGLGAIVAIPAAGIVMVFVLLSILWLEARLSGAALSNS